MVDNLEIKGMVSEHLVEKATSQQLLVMNEQSWTKDFISHHFLSSEPTENCVPLLLTNMTLIKHKS